MEIYIILANKLYVKWVLLYRMYCLCNFVEDYKLHGLGRLVIIVEIQILIIFNLGIFGDKCFVHVSSPSDVPEVD